MTDTELRERIEQCFVGHNFPNTEVVVRIHKLVADACTVARVDTINKVYELSPTQAFEHWKPKDALAFYERLKAYEAELQKGKQ